MSHIKPAPRMMEIDGKQLLFLPARLPLEQALAHQELPDFFRQTLKRVDWQRRNEFTIARSLTSTHLLPPWAAALLAWNARVLTEEGEKLTPVDSYFLRSQSIPGKISGLAVPHGVTGRVWARETVARSPADRPIVSVVAVLDLRDQVVQQARIALTGVWDRAAGLADSAQDLIGRSLEQSLIGRVASSLEKEVAPQGDYLGSVRYRQAMARLLTRRALEACSGKEK